MGIPLMLLGTNIALIGILYHVIKILDELKKR